MFQKLYARAVSVNWQVTVTCILLLMAIAMIVASNSHWMPQQTLVAVNWEDRVSKYP